VSPGLSVPHYRITAKLGEGGLRELWRATDTKLNREVAIKILPEGFAKDAESMSLSSRSALALRRAVALDFGSGCGKKDRRKSTQKI
jgi:serine/threonine-protein kinase